MSHRLLARETTLVMLRCHAGDEEEGYYGYGIWLKPADDHGFCPYFQGCDPGVSFISLHEPREDAVITLVSNYRDNVWRLLKSIRECMFGK